MAVPQGKISGTAYLSIDGITYQLASDPKWGVSTVKREGQIGMDGPHGFKETPIMGFISGTLRDSAGITVGAIGGMTNVTVVLELASGKVIIGRNMYSTDSQEVDSTEATFAVRFESESVVEA